MQSFRILIRESEVSINSISRQFEIWSVTRKIVKPYKHVCDYVDALFIDDSRVHCANKAISNID